MSLHTSHCAVLPENLRKWQMYDPLRQYFSVSTWPVTYVWLWQTGFNALKTDFHRVLNIPSSVSQQLAHLTFVCINIQGPLFKSTSVNQQVAMLTAMRLNHTCVNYETNSTHSSTIVRDSYVLLYDIPAHSIVIVSWEALAVAEIKTYCLFNKD